MFISLLARWESTKVGQHSSMYGGAGPTPESYWHLMVVGGESSFFHDVAHGRLPMLQAMVLYTHAHRGGTNWAQSVMKKEE